MDFKEFLLFLAQLFDSNKIKDIAGKLKDNDTAISDDVSEELKSTIGDNMSNLMSMEAAQNNANLEGFFKKKLFPSMKGEILGNLDTEVDSLAASLLGANDVSEITGTENTKEKIRLFGEKAKAVLKKRFSGSDVEEKFKELQEQYNKAQEEFANKLQEKEKEFEQHNLQWQDKFIANRFQQMAKEYNWQEALKNENVQPYLISQLYEKIKQKAMFKMNETGEIDVYQKDNPGTFLFDGNKKIGFKDLLEKEIDPYIDKAPAKKTFTKPPDHRQIPGDRPLSKIAELQRSSADVYKNKVQKVN